MKDALDDSLADAQDRIDEWCGHCSERPEVVELLGRPAWGLMSVRLRCPRCGRTWGVGLGHDSFWREDD